MKKKIFVLLMSLAMVVTMMPLSVFAGEQNSVRTEIPGTGLTLVGDREATPSAGESEKTGDYYVSQKGLYVNIDTSGWKIEGTSEYEVYFTPEGDGKTLELGDLTIPYFEKEYSGQATITVSGDVIVDDEGQTTSMELCGDVYLRGNGSITLPNGALLSYGEGGNALTLDVAKVNVNQEETIDGNGVAIVSNDLEIRSGQVIARCNTPITDVSPLSIGIVSLEKDLVISDDAEVFASGNQAAIVGPTEASFNVDKFFGNSEKLTYEQKDQVSSPVKTENVTFSKYTVTTLAMLEENGVALTAYHPAVKPEPVMHKVTFMDGDTVYTTQKVADGYCAKMPVDPEEDGYKFTGWYLDKEAKDAYNFDTPVTADLTLYAGWEKNAEPTPPVNPNSGSTGANTGDSAMPIIYITLGFAAAVVGFYGFRRLRDR